MLECPKCSFVPPNPAVLYCPRCGAKRDVQKPARERKGTGKPKRKLGLGAKVGIGVAAFLLLYAGSFIVLSQMGQYKPDISGVMRTQLMTPIEDVQVWQPAGVYFNRYVEVDGRYVIVAKPLGWFYLPLVMIDRHYFHLTKRTKEASEP